MDDWSEKWLPSPTCFSLPVVLTLFVCNSSMEAMEFFSPLQVFYPLHASIKCFNLPAKVSLRIFLAESNFFHGCTFFNCTNCMFEIVSFLFTIVSSSSTNPRKLLFWFVCLDAPPKLFLSKNYSWHSPEHLLGCYEEPLRKDFFLLPFPANISIVCFKFWHMIPNVR